MGAAPAWFLCPNERKANQRRRWLGERREVERHVVRLTGEKRDNPSHNRGARSSDHEREYVCETCGHRGWSRHKELERMEEARQC